VIPATDLTHVVAAGRGATVKLRGLDVPPPGFGFDTVTWMVPALAKSVAGMLAVSSVALVHGVSIFVFVPTQVVGSAFPFH
jgi:hypothetical protein